VFHVQYSPPDITVARKIKKNEKTRERAACLSERKDAYKVLVGKPKKFHVEDRCVDGRIILKLILREVGAWNGVNWLRIGKGGGLL
jgi:hypothetical protein